MHNPSGIEKVVALATLGPEWRTRVLADPLAAARDAGIGLADSESAVLRSIQRPALEHMIDSFHESVPRPAGLARLAAGAAIAALLATGTVACDGGMFSAGVRPHVPPTRTQQDKTTQPGTSGPAGTNAPR